MGAFFSSEDEMLEDARLEKEGDAETGEERKVGTTVRHEEERTDKITLKIKKQNEWCVDERAGAENSGICGVGTYTMRKYNPDSPNKPPYPPNNPPLTQFPFPSEMHGGMSGVRTIWHAFLRGVSVSNGGDMLGTRMYMYDDTNKMSSSSTRGGYTWDTYTEVHRLACDFGVALRVAGCTPCESNVGVWAKNRTEVVVAMLGEF